MAEPLHKKLQKTRQKEIIAVSADFVHVEELTFKVTISDVNNLGKW
jgi:hypothetical protein